MGRLPLGIPGISTALSNMDEPWVEDILCFRVVRACMSEDQKGEHVCVYACARMEVELPVSGSPQKIKHACRDKIQTGPVLQRCPVTWCLHRVYIGLT